MNVITGSKIHAEMFNVTTALYELATIGGPNTVNEPLRVALVTILDHVDALVAALPVVGGLPSRAPRPVALRDVTMPAGCPIPVRLERAQAETLCAIVLALSTRVMDTLAWAKVGCSKREFSAYRPRAGYVVGYLYTELLRPLWHQHPDLEPAEMREPR